MPDRFDPVLDAAWETAVCRLASGAEVLGGVYPMSLAGGVVLLAVADDESRAALETAEWKPRLLILLGECLGASRNVTALAGVVDHHQQEPSFRTVPR
ncbi:hypothetical protein [Streptomyces sp. NBC_01264]|uniref:hypothetical protein n=1 Tax=Streptomyces sp. NBC_01264 TaxID=2903804 RepID=UPI00225A9CDC|nr:hypothetical protein [Streptomyces sp. NBC_01264]MCX4784306.1 hypothetical protein [Streptomyces sp. NBC_01264]